MANCEAILQAGGASLDDVVEVGVLLTDPSDFARMSTEYGRWFPKEPPTRYVTKLGVEIPQLLIAIRMTAFTGRPSGRPPDPNVRVPIRAATYARRNRTGEE